MTSDFDVLVSFDDVSPEIILGLRRVIEQCSERWILIDFNVHSSSEMPENSLHEFWHNNRWLIFQKEISMFWVPIIWENPYQKYSPAVDLVRADIRRHVSGLVYRARKTLINTQLTYKDKLNLVKFALYAISNALADLGLFYLNKQNIVDAFHEHFPSFLGS